MPTRRASRVAVLFSSVALLFAACWLLAPVLDADGNVQSVKDRSVYYRLVSKYQHGEEIIDFDIVVGCGVRVTRYGDGGSSYDAFRDPVAYVKGIEGGGAVMQIVPSACLGETSENGKVPDDFLPGALWFDRTDDLSLGIAYVTEDAFENPKSKLKFLGASIHAATRSQWEEFQPIAQRNLIDPRPLFSILPMPDPETLKKSLGDSRALTKLWPGMSCHVVTSLRLSDAARTVVREYLPSSRPRYWLPSEQQLNEIDRRARLFSEMMVNGYPATKYLKMGHHTAIGFPTRTQGGMIGSAHKPWDQLPPTVYPLRRDEGIPWVKPNALTDDTLYRHVELDGGANRGFGYCYRRIPVDGLRSTDSAPVQFATRVDDWTISGEETDSRQARNRPWPFFENDEYLYLPETFGLN
jgi:hypothetical protein